MLRRLGFLVALLASVIAIPAIAGPTSDVVPCGFALAGSTFCAPTPIALSTNPNGGTGTSGPYIQATGSGISGRIMMQDEMADGIDVNTSSCASTTTFGASPTPVQSLELLYIPASLIRHFRENFAVCYNESAHDTYWNNLCNLDGIDTIGNWYAYMPISMLRTETATYPCVREWEFSNEYDSYLGDSNGTIKLSAATSVGATTVNLGSQIAGKFLVPGAQYYFNDGSGEVFTAAAPTAQTDVTTFQVVGAGGAGLLQSHAINAPVVRNTIAGDYTYVPYTYYAAGEAALIKKYTNWNMMCPNIAQPIDGYYFFNNGRTMGSYCDINDGHLYGQQATIEDTLGDWSKSAVTLPHGTCSAGNGTSYSFYYNRCGSTAFLNGYPYENKNLYITEYSNEVGPVGAATPAAQTKIIPDDYGMDMLTRFFVGIHNHGAKRAYWFQMIDGTSGCSSGFYSYGLIYEGPYSCTPNNTAYPQSTPIPKPEFLAMMNLIDATTDAGCRFPACQFTPTAPTVTWSPAALPLQTAMTEDSSGTYDLFYWVGSSGFTQPCNSATSNCYTAVTPISVTLSGASLAGLASVQNYGFSDVSTGPSPGPTGVLRADGNTYTVPEKCPWPPTTTYFGCVKAPTPVSVSASSVSLTAQQYMQWVRFKPLGVPTPTVTVAPTYAPPSPIPT